MVENSEKSAIDISIRKVAAPAASLAAIFVLWRLGLKWWCIPVIVLLAAYYAVVPRLVKNHVRRFNRNALLLLGSGKSADILKLVGRSMVLRFLAPRNALDARLALAYGAQEDYKKAAACFKNAIPRASAVERPGLLAGLAKACLVTGDLDGALANGDTLLESGTRLPEVLVVVARARIGLGRIDDETRNLLDESAKLSPSADVRLMIDLSRLEMNLLTGRKPGELPENADSPQRFLRAWIHLVRGLLRAHRNDDAGAKQSFHKALKEDLDRGFVTAAANWNLDSEH